MLKFRLKLLIWSLYYYYMFYEFIQVMNIILPSCNKAEDYKKMFEVLNVKK